MYGDGGSISQGNGMLAAYNALMGGNPSYAGAQGASALYANPDNMRQSLLNSGWVPGAHGATTADWSNRTGYWASTPGGKPGGMGAPNTQPAAGGPVSVGGLGNGGVTPAMLAQILRGGGFSPGGAPGQMMPSYDPGMSAGESGMAPGGQFAGLNRQMYRPAPSMPGMPNANAAGQFLGPNGQQQMGFLGARRSF